MKKQRLIAFALALVLLALSLAGCGATSGTTAAYAADTAAGANEEVAEVAKDAASADGGLTGDSGETALPENRKWIVTMYLSAETEDLDALTEALGEQIAALGGYMEDQNVYNGSAYASRRYRSASFTVRIPAENADAFTGAVAGIANLVSSEKSLEDVTLSYSTAENRVQALETEQTRLMELMEQAETMSDLLEIEERLTEVRYQLENYGSQLKLYDNQIDYATIYLDVEEVQEYTPVEEPSTWERIRDGFLDSLKGVGEGAVDIGVFLLANLPYLVVYGALIALAVMLLRRYRRRRKAKKMAQAAAKSEEQKPE